jgi:DNA-binding response OmpR family regulator
MNNSPPMKKILVVEDDEFLVDTYKVKLTDERFHVATARDGEEALVKVKEFSPDLIILDLLMPKKDGFAVLTELKKNEQTKKIPVLIASNLEQDDAVERGLSLGAEDYFIKSNISITELVEKCRKHLAGRSP